MIDYQVELNTTKNHFEGWLVFLINDFPTGQAELYDEIYKMNLKKIDSRFKSTTGIEGITEYEISVADIKRIKKVVRNREDIECDVPIIRIYLRETDTGIGIAIECVNHEYINTFLLIEQKISHDFPEILRFTRYRGYSLPLDTTLFDLIIEVEQVPFIYTCESILGQLAPDEFRIYGSNAFLNHRSFHLNHKPDPKEPVWLFELIAKKVKFFCPENSFLHEKQDGTIAIVELQQILDKRHRLLCLSGTTYPGIIEWFKNFKEKIMLFCYPKCEDLTNDSLRNEKLLPNNNITYPSEAMSKKCNSDLLVKPNSLMNWENIPEDEKEDRLIAKLFCEGKTNTEIANIVHLQKETVTNRISSLRKKYDLPYSKDIRNLLISQK